MHVLVQNMALDLSPMTRERDVLIVTEDLLAEHQQMMTQKRVVKRREDTVIEWLRQIDACDLRAQHVAKRANVELSSRPAWRHCDSCG